jgi:hypothetical protein
VVDLGHLGDRRLVWAPPVVPVPLVSLVSLEITFKIVVSLVVVSLVSLVVGLIVRARGRRIPIRRLI